MHKCKIVIVCLMLFVNNAAAQSKSNIVSSVMKSIETYHNYDINYRVDSKFLSSDDTVSNIFSSTFLTAARKPVTGYSKVLDLRKGENYSFAFNSKTLVLLEEESKSYFQMNSKDDKAGFSSRLNNNIYLPFIYAKEFYSKFDLQDTNDSFYTLSLLDTSKDNLIVTKTTLTISKSTFLPVQMKEWNWYDGDTEYKSYTLMGIKKIPEKSASSIRNKSLSLMKHYKSFLNGDSIWQAYFSKFKPVQVGDSLKNFKGYIHGSLDSVEVVKIKDSILILDFAYTSCGPCALSAPKLNNINYLYKNKGVVLFSVDPYSSDWPKLDKFIANYKVTYPVLKVDRNVEMKYGIEGYPTILLFKNGVLKFICHGSPEDLENILIQEINKLL